MSRPRGFNELAGRRVGVWGLGVEGRDVCEVLKQVGATIVAVDDVAVEFPNALVTSDGGLTALRECDIVIKSPGIPRRRADVLELEASGVLVTSATAIWLAGTDRNLVIGVTGTKGKSTTTSLITFMLRACGASATSAGNIGVTPFKSLEAPDAWTVLEVSSFQATDITDAPAIVVLTSLGEDHVDWHGSLEQYRRDKLQLTRAEGFHHTVVPDDVEILLHRSEIGGELLTVAETDPELAELLGLIGAHNAQNVALALRTVALALHRPIDEVRAAAITTARDFSPLPGRLTLVHRAKVNGHPIDFIDDGLATNPLPVVAAARSFTNQPLALIVGGFDRGVDYDPLVDGVAELGDSLTLIVMGEAGQRIADASLVRTPQQTILAADDLYHAVDLAVGVLTSGGVVLFSPGAPSFDHYKNWKERSAHFTALAARY